MSNNIEIQEKMKRKIIEGIIEAPIIPYVRDNIGMDYAYLLEYNELTPYLEKKIRDSNTFKNITNSRSDIQLCKELVYSRTVENRILDYFNKDVVLCGTDKDSIISSYATHFPDMYSISYNYYIENIMSFSSAFIRKMTIFLPRKKFEYLQNFSADRKVCLFVYDIAYKVFFTIPFPIKELIELEDENFYYISLKGCNHVYNIDEFSYQAIIDMGEYFNENRSVC